MPPKHLSTALTWIALCLLLGGVSTHRLAAQEAFVDSTAPSSRLGITFISSTEHPDSERRYRNALLLGAGWNRWPLYWNEVEPTPGQENWLPYDRLVHDDIRYGLQTNAILLGIPAGYRDGAVMRGLAAPIFADGSDTPAPGKAINPDNPWARFVYAAVTRYKPGGTLAGQLGWPAGAGVRIWEAWNEPDLSMFWNGSIRDYARLLKVTYLAAHHADPAAQVMFGGLAYVNPDADDWLARTLDVIAADPDRAAFNWYFDRVAVHNYSNARRSGWIVAHARAVLARYGLARPIWLNESGVPVWDDYPGPTWAADLGQRRLRATSSQQAAFVLQSTAFAWQAGAEVVFFHQLYDDCGNQAAGTDFAPHQGDLCAGGACWGDAHGLYRNERSAVCFRQHPQPGTPRLAAGAFHLLARVFGSANVTNGTVIELGSATVVAFDRPLGFGAVTEAQGISERLYVLWNQTPSRVVVQIPASSSEAELYRMDNEDFALAPDMGSYSIGLEPMTAADYPDLGAGDRAIGGPTYIMVERITPGMAAADPLRIHLQGAAPPAHSPITVTPGPIGEGAHFSNPTPPPTPADTPMPTPRPTLDPALDTHAPIPFVDPLPPDSPTEFTLRWGARDESGIDRYLVWVRVDDGAWEPWQETDATEAVYSGSAGTQVEFAVWAVDLAGNWSLNTELEPQAITLLR